MQGMIRCGLLAGLLIACHTSDPGTPDSGVDGSAGGAGMHVSFATKPVIPGNVEDTITLDSATFAFDNLQVIGDAGPGDTRTTATLFQLKWDAMTMPGAIDFSDAPTGVYSKVSFQIDGHLIDSSYRLKGQVNIGGNMVGYEIEDHNALPLSLDINRTLTPGGSAVIGVVIDFGDALAGVDWSMVPMDDGKLELETSSSQMPGFRMRLVDGFSIDDTIN
jgi:hypothetical protein